MTKRKLGFGIVAMLLAVMLVLSGCNSKDKSPKDALQASLTSSSEMTSYKFKGSLKFEELNIPVSEFDTQALMGLDMLESAEVSWTGTYRADPMLMEVILKLELKSDLNINLNVPIVMSEKKVWVKIPNIPMVPLPQEIVGKFVELDLEELAEQSGQEIPQVDMELSQEFTKDVVDIVFKHLKAEDYLSSVKVKDANLPSDVDAKQVVRFKVDKNQIEPLIRTTVEKIAPEILDLIDGKDKYRKYLNVTKEDIQEMKQAMKDEDLSDLDASMAELQDGLKKFDIVSNIGIDKKNFPVYSDVKFTFAAEKDGESGTISIKAVQQLSNINDKDIKFEVGEPDSKDILPFEELFGDMSMLMGGGLGLDSSF